ncbi:hypothetical protein EBI01_02655 [Marinomonas rhizomae]|uniref:2-keto-4-pentenoate hydratase n=1 Tax=Marinomonas rhizomae TaxID=491948 RepID=A0A366JGQ9_9GAMM|nr:hypothetical protein [Marinomonas rhizomae]RBP85619.1 hypothetical protein DFP80_101114 [Marinomonas rhizomae]RNF75753.1 hypothetical protein EBI01_02655 [Marinomonas rhizomae]
MVFEEYSQVIKEFQHEESLSLTDRFDAVCMAQDALIAKIVEQGAVIAGWKIVDKDGVIIISPIFDFQVFANLGDTFAHQACRGTELEVCFQLTVPSTTDAVNELINELVPFAAVELIRAEIHPTNHSACDFYFNYGVLVSPKTVTGELLFEGGNQDYIFTAELDQLLAAKKEVVKKGILQCIQRGYGNKDYFFITGTLNGLVPAAESLGVNRVMNQGEVIIQFEIV